MENASSDLLEPSSLNDSSAPLTSLNRAFLEECFLVLKDIENILACDIEVISHQHSGLSSRSRSKINSKFSSVHSEIKKSHSPIFWQQDTQHYFSVPCVSGLNLTGILHLYLKEYSDFSPAEERIIHVIAKSLAGQIKESDDLHELYPLISKHNRDWIFVKDKDFRIVYANDAFLNLYPETIRDAVIGTTTLEEYDEEEAKEFLKEDQIAFSDGLSDVIEEIAMPDGTRKILNTVKRRFHTPDNTAFILGIARDITDQELLIRKLKKANSDLDEFISIASHDLRSPLNAIEQLLEWIKEDCADILPSEASENLQLVIQRANRMRGLIYDLLTYAKIGTVNEPVRKVSLEDLVKEVIEFNSSGDDIQLTVNDFVLEVPFVAFRTVMLNLVSNALKHTDKSNCTIDISAKESARYYQIDVSDNGPGIPREYHEKVFELFQTLKSRDQTEGSGVGLSLVKKIVTEARGTISIDSDGLSGTTFSIKWPKVIG